MFSILYQCLPLKSIKLAKQVMVSDSTDKLANAYSTCVHYNATQKIACAILTKSKSKRRSEWSLSIYDRCIPSLSMITFMAPNSSM